MEAVFSLCHRWLSILRGWDRGNPWRRSLGRGASVGLMLCCRRGLGDLGVVPDRVWSVAWRRVMGGYSLLLLFSCGFLFVMHYKGWIFSYNSRDYENEKHVTEFSVVNLSWRRMMDYKKKMKSFWLIYKSQSGICMEDVFFFGGENSWISWDVDFALLVCFIDYSTRVHWDGLASDCGISWSCKRE